MGCEWNGLSNQLLGEYDSRRTGDVPLLILREANELLQQNEGTQAYDLGDRLHDRAVLRGNFELLSDVS